MGQLQRTESVSQSSDSTASRDSGGLAGLLDVLTRELLRCASQDDRLRSALHQAALSVVRATAAPDSSGRLSGPQLHDASSDGPGREDAQTGPGEFSGPATLDSGLQERESRPRYSDVDDTDLPLIVKRCRLKAEGTRWAVERDELLRDGADFAEEIRPVDAEIIEQAKALPNCFLWMNQPRNDTWTRADDYLLVADCFDTLADTLETMHVVMEAGNAEQFMEAVLLVAEAQSAVRCAVAQVETHADSDQQQTYHWLRNRASRDRFYISRYMRISDPADPEDCDDVSARALKLKETVDRLTPSDQPAQRQTLQHRLRKLAGALADHDQDDREAVSAAIEALCDEDYASVLPELSQLLLPYEAELRDLDVSEPAAALLATVWQQTAGPGESGSGADAA